MSQDLVINDYDAVSTGSGSDRVLITRPSSVPGQITRSLPLLVLTSSLNSIRDR